MSEIKSIRDHLGLTQAEMAEALGINQSTLSRMEAGIVTANKRTILAAKALRPVRRSTQPTGAAA